VTQLFEAEDYKTEDGRFESRWGSGDSHSLKPSGRTVPLGSTQSVTEMSTGVKTDGV